QAPGHERISYADHQLSRLARPTLSSIRLPPPLFPLPPPADAVQLPVRQIELRPLFLFFSSSSPDLFSFPTSFLSGLTGSQLPILFSSLADESAIGWLLQSGHRMLRSWTTASAAVGSRQRQEYL